MLKKEKNIHIRKKNNFITPLFFFFFFFLRGLYVYFSLCYPSASQLVIENMKNTFAILQWTIYLHIFLCFTPI